jgi:hypothetical protein
MNLFTRVRTTKLERLQEGRAFAVEIAAQVSESTGIEVTPWATVYGAPAGTLSFTAVVDSQAAMGASMEKLGADTAYQKKISEAAGNLFTGPGEDLMGEVVNMVGTPGAAHYSTIVTAQCAPGKIAAAMAWAVDIQTHVHKLTNQDGLLLRGLYGPFGTLAWIGLAGSLADIDATNAAMSADPTYIEQLDKAGELFVTGSVEQRLVQRLT